MPNNWMVRAGRGGIYIEDFEKGYQTIKWPYYGTASRMFGALR